MAQYRGTVKSFSEQKGYGFIDCPETHAIYGKDVFVLKHALQQGAVPGDQVTFSVVDSHKGPQAENILVLNRPMAAATAPAFASPGGFISPPNGAYGGPGPAGFPQNFGVVKSFNPTKGWGFITSQEILQTFGKDLFFMKTSLLEPVQQDQQVCFSIFQSDKGAQAQNIRPAQSAAPMGGPMGAPMGTPMGAAPMGATASRMPAAFRAPAPVAAPGPNRFPSMAAQSVAQQSASQLEYFFGTVKGYNEERGWGFIICQAAKNLFGKEVFLLRTALDGQVAEPGALVGFKVNVTPKGPQASSVVVLPPESFGVDGQPGRRFVASVKRYYQEKGWGFVTSEEIQSLFFGKDIFLHNKQLNDSSVKPNAGDEAHFSIEFTADGKLQAREVDIVPRGDGLEEVHYEPVKAVPSKTLRSAPY